MLRRFFLNSAMLPSMRTLVVLLLNFISVVSLGFGQDQLNEDVLRKLSRLSERELIQEIQKEVVLYRFGREDLKAQMIEGLTNIPEMSQEMYRQFSWDIMSGAVGIYLSPNDNRWRVQKPTMILREDSTAWVLIHEYSHYLLDKSRNQKSIYNPNESLGKLQDNLDGFKENLAWFRSNGGKFRNQAHESETGESLIVASELTLQLFAIFELEEIKIESTLRHIYETESGLNLNEKDYKDAAEYIAENKKSIKSGIAIPLSGIKELKSFWSNEQMRIDLDELELQMLRLSQNLGL